MEKAIVIYVDNSENSDIEFSWTYKTWKLWSLDSEYDLVVYSHPDKFEDLNQYEGIKLIKMDFLSQFNDFNSFYIFSNDMDKNILSYQYILKCELGSFLTENLKKFTPSKFTLGEGEWMSNEKVDFIKKVSSDLKLHPGNISSIGKSFYGKTLEVISMIKGVYQLSEIIEKKYKKASDFINCEFSDTDITSIAIDIFVNHAFNNQSINIYQLDTKPYNISKIGSNVLQLIPGTNELSWSKKLFFQGVYQALNTSNRYAFINGFNYCNWISKLSIKEIDFYRNEYLKNKLEIDYGLFEISSNINSNDKFSVIIPTMWESDTILELLLNLNGCDLVDEIILIDNQPNKKIDFNLDKVKIFTTGENIFVNPAWNWGVELAKNNLLSICNDDILFNVNEVFSAILENHQILGCVGIHKDSYDSNGEPKIIENLYIPASGWGCLIFCKKENWIDIPNSLKVGYGDDWILKTNKPHWSFRTNSKITTKMSTTSKKAEFNKNVTNDIKIWKRIFQ